MPLADDLPCKALADVPFNRGNIDAVVGRKWQRKPQPTPAPEAPPAAMLLDGGEALQPDAAVCLGWYVLDESRSPINNKPVWRHTCVAGRWLAHDGSAWLCQVESNLGHPRGSLKLEGCGDHPSVAQAGAVWKSAASRGWIVQPKLTCRAATLQEMQQGLMTAECAALEAMVRSPPCAALLLEDGKLGCRAPKQCLGWYRLQSNRVINLRPVWCHAENEGIWLAFDQSDWVVSQVLEEESRAIPLMHISDPLANALPYQLVTRSWAVQDDCDWVAQPTVRCRGVDVVPRPLEDRLTELLRCLEMEAGVQPQGTSELHIHLQAEGGMAQLETALREAGLTSLASLEAADAAAVAAASGLSAAAASDLKTQAFLQLHPEWKPHLYQLADGGPRGREMALLPALRDAQLRPEHVHALRLYSGAFACGRKGARADTAQERREGGLVVSIRQGRSYPKLSTDQCKPMFRSQQFEQGVVAAA
jgi:hypothetical protein